MGLLKDQLENFSRPQDTPSRQKKDSASLVWPILLEENGRPPGRRLLDSVFVCLLVGAPPGEPLAGSEVAQQC